MFIACELIEGKVYTLDHGGYIYCIEIGNDLRPQIKQVGFLYPHEEQEFMMHRFQRFHNAIR